jgi:DNA-binding NtrC family response regulator
MEAADWPGNVRELENAVHRLVILHGTGSMIDDLAHIFVASSAALRAPGESEIGAGGPQDAPAHAARDRATGAGPGSTEMEAAGDATYFAAKDRFESHYIRAALRAARGNISRAARECGLDRGNFKLKMQKHGIAAEEFRRGK